MSNDLVAVATFSDPLEAELARNRLEADGIDARLADSETVAMNWGLTQAVGGVKLLVRIDDEDRALDVIEAHARGLDRMPTERRESSQHIVAEENRANLAAADAMGDEDEIETARENNAERAFKAQIFSFLVPPLQVYALILIYQVLGSEERLAGRPRTMFSIAVVLHVICWLFFAMALSVMS